MTRLSHCTPLLAALLLTLGWQGAAFSTELYFIDAHSQMDSQVSEANILRLMQQNNVRSTLLSARAQRKPRDILQFAQRQPGTIIPSLATKQAGYIARSKDKQQQAIQLMQKMAASGRFRAMAETLMWHSGCPNDQCPAVEVYSDDPRVQTAFAIAKAQRWPFILHIEFGSLSQSKRARFMSDLETMLDEHPDQPFALIHMGQLQAPSVAALIERHANIYFLTAHANTHAVRSAAGVKPWVDMFDGRALAEPWRQLVMAHPERFIFALDNVFSQTHWQSDFYRRQIDLWRDALAQLPDPIAHAVAHGNAERLWNISPAQ